MSFQTIAVDSLLALSVVATFGAGRFSLAGPGFMALGAYAAAMSGRYVHDSIWLCVIASAAVSFLTGIVANRAVRGLPAVPYSLATLSLSLVMPLLAGALHVARATAHPSGSVFAATVCLVTGVLALTMTKGRHHFAVGAAAAGVAGALYWSTGAALTPSAFGLDRLGIMVAAALVGGVASPLAPVLGALLLALATRLAAPLTDQPLVVDGVILLVALVYLPGGLWTALVAVMRSISTAPKRPVDGAS